MTKAVAQALIAESAVIPVNILHPLRHRLVDPAAVLQPIDVKVLPEGSGSTLQHPPIIRLEHLQRRFHILRRRNFQQIIAHERGHTAGPILQHNGRRLLLVQQAGQSKHGGGLL